MTHEKHSMDQHPERRFHYAEGHRIPLFIRLAWTIFIVAGLIYLARYSWPDLVRWLAK
jgi:hypothetical protein